MKNFILKDEVKIYNNRAKSGNSLGRLLVTYNIYPAPAIFWEFETETKANELPKYDGDHKLISPFRCEYFTLFTPTVHPHFWIGRNLAGSASKAIRGDTTIKGRSFTFFVPNAKFQQVGIRGQHFIVKEIKYRKPKGAEAGHGPSMSREGYLEANFGDNFSLTMSTPDASMEWLEKWNSTGVYLTTQGTFSTKHEILIDDAADLLSDIFFLLSFANGGLTAPLIVEMNGHGNDQEFPCIYTSFEIDPTENIRGTWLDTKSHIDDLLECFPSFQKMLKSNSWKTNYDLILIWYFQAIQRSGVQVKGKPWPVVGNAVGAALEKLASIILVEELKFKSKNKFNEMKFEDRIRYLLTTIGISQIGPLYDKEDAVSWFVKLRNDATHPRSSRQWKQEEVNVILDNAIQWVEEVLLWRLGYKGGYSDRSRRGLFIKTPRYKLDTRDPSW